MFLAQELFKLFVRRTSEQIGAQRLQNSQSTLFFCNEDKEKEPFVFFCSPRSSLQIGSLVLAEQRLFCWK